MFEKARLKLTGWYLLIIMIISLGFSLVIYRGVGEEIERSLRSQQFRLYRLEHPFEPPPPLSLLEIDPGILEEVRRRLIMILAIVNGGILFCAGVAGYFLAGRTLQPIQLMIREQNRFISDISHELKTPLTSLKTGIEVYFRDSHHRLSEAHALLSSNLEEVNHLQTLSDTLLQLSSYEHSHHNLPFEDVSLSEIIKTAVKQVRPLADKKHITFKVEAEDVFLPANLASLIQLLVILLDNAIKYSPDHSMVTVTDRLTDTSVIIKVIDQGSGIPPQDLPHIFDRFYRADRSRSKQVDGYGLGLSIAKRIVEIHRGTIQAASTEKVGSTFRVKLPRHRS